MLKSEVNMFQDTFVSPILKLPVHQMILSPGSRDRANFLKLLFPVWSLVTHFKI